MLGAMSLVVLFYLTEYLGLAPSVAGALIFLSRLWDVGAALLIGQASDRSSSRWGRRAPFLFAAGPVAALGYVALFAAPTSLDGTALQGWVLVALLCYATGYSLFVVPYLAVPAEITAIAQQRTTMMAYRVVFMTAAALNVAVLGPLLIEAFGKGRSGYFGMAVVQGAIVLAAMCFCAIVVSRTPTVSSAPASPASSWAQIRMVLQHRPFVVYLIVKLLQLSAVASTSASLLYLARYVLGQDESFLVRFGVLQTLGTLLSLPLWTWLGRRFGKRDAYVGAGFFYALVALSWLAAAGGEPGWVTDARLLLIGIGSTGLLVLGFSLLPDIMAHNTQVRGVALEGTMGALYSVVEKGTAAVGPLLGGIVLQSSGFVSAAGKALPPAQPASAILAIVVLSAVVPALFNVAGSLALLRFKLDEPLPATSTARST